MRVVHINNRSLLNDLLLNDLLLKERLPGKIRYHTKLCTEALKLNPSKEDNLNSLICSLKKHNISKIGHKY